MRRLPALLLLAFVPLAFADDTPARAQVSDKSKKADSDVILPADPTPPKPPQPNPAVPAQLGSDALFIVRANVDCVVLSSPSGILKVTKDAGPLKLRAKLYGGDGTVQTVTYAEKFIYSVETLAKGTAELLIIPPNAGEKDIIRRQIEALDGPQPPPAPPVPPVPPVPPTPTDPLTKAIQAAYDAETDADKQTELSTLTALAGLAVPMSKADPNVKTLLQFQTKVHNAIEGSIGVGKLPLVRKAASEYVATKLPKTDQTMTDVIWTQAAQAYGDIQKALRGIK